MNKVLEELKAVQGVSGVLILDLERRVTYQLLPAHFEKDNLRSLASALLELSQKYNEPVRIDLKFDNGMAFFTRFNQRAVLIYGRPGLNLPLLKLVVRSSIRTIERKLEMKVKKTKEKPEEGKSTPFAKTYVQTLVEALNQLAEAYKKFTGDYLLTQNLRLAREKLLKEFPYLSNFYVDNNGMISQAKDTQELVRKDAVFSFSRWAFMLTELSCEISPRIAELNIRDLTKEMAEKLEEMEFYQFYENKKTEKSLLGF